jgi:hypothetical protein
MKHLLITADIDWADEFSCSMFGVFTDEQWKVLCGKTKKYFEKWEKGERNDDAYSESGEVEAGFGTNESLTFSNVKAFLLSLLFCGLVLSAQAATGPVPPNMVNNKPTVTTQAEHPAIVRSSRGPVVSDEQTITLIASAKGQTPFTFQWYKNNVAIPGAVGTSLVIKVSAVGAYYVRVTNRGGSTDGDTVTIANVNGKVQVTF